MVKSLNPQAPNLKSSRPAVVFQYLQKALTPQVRLTPGSTKGAHNAGSSFRSNPLRRPRACPRDPTSEVQVSGVRSKWSTFSRTGSESESHPRQPSNVTFTQREDRSRSPRQAVEQDGNITASWQRSIASEGPIAVLITGPGAGGYSPTDCFRHAARPGCEENFISSEEEEITKPREKTARQHEDLLSSLTDSNQGAGHLQAGESCHRSPGSEESAEERAFLPSSATRTKAGHSSASFAPVKSASHSSTSFASANSSRTKSAYSTGEGESRPSLSEAESFSLEGSREEGQGP